MEYRIDDDIIIDCNLTVPSSVTADAEYSMPVEYVEIPLQPDLFRHNTLVSFDGETYQYIGQAPYGSEEDEAVWFVTRIVYDSLGAKIVKQVYANQKWTDYKN